MKIMPASTPAFFMILVVCLASAAFGALFACLVLSMIPIVILYLLFQKQILSGTDAAEGLK